jgi:hypothetical protein
VAHPAELLFQEGRQNAAVDLVDDALGNQGRDRAQRSGQQLVGEGQGIGGLRGKEGHHLIVGVRQADTRALRPDMGRKGPGRFLADGPDVIRDRVQEASPVFQAFGRDQDMETLAPFIPEILIVAAVAVPPVLKVHGGRQWRHVEACHGLGLLQDPRSLGRRNPLPCLPVGQRRKGMPLAGRAEHRLETGRRVGGRQGDVVGRIFGGGPDLAQDRTKA